MYTPSHFREERPDVLEAFIRAHPLAALVLPGPDGLEATHVPLLLEDGVLRGHVARANPIWRSAGAEALAIFHGAQIYVSPAWYPSKAADPRVVPTWNYIAVHAYGPLRVVENRDALLGIVTRMTETFEAPRSEPWRVSDAPASYIDGLLNAIAGIEIPISRLEGKWKASQNRTEEDREAVLRRWNISP
ncbi:MAG: FMN-binding negative transcriptional regulator [Acidobacteria bacterium]|nr:FMN-binding negative transcriptional regulator [Acidobacteriota bacterium]